MGWLVLAGVGVVAFGAGIYWWQRWWLILDTPTSDAAHVFIGFNEVAGKVRAISEPLVSPLTGDRCVWWHYKLQRYEKSGDSSSWHTKDEGTYRAPFEIVDASGAIRVDPVEMHLAACPETTLAKDDLPYVTVNQLHAAATQVRHALHGGIIDSIFGNDVGTGTLTMLDGKWRAIEQTLRDGEQVYAQGEASMRDDAAVVGVKLGAPLHVRVGSEAAARDRAQIYAMAGTVLGAGALVMAPGVVAGRPNAWMIVTGAGVALVLLTSYLVRLYNRLVRVRQQAEKAWSLISVATQRRADLVPRLAAVTLASFTHESEMQDLLARARATVGSARLPDPAAAGAAQDAAQAGGRLLALGEASPDLHADTNAAALFVELRHTEDNVAFARRFYNDAVEILRTRSQSFPDNLVAPWVRVPNLPLFNL
jgi:LemA protein